MSQNRRPNRDHRYSGPPRAGGQGGGERRQWTPRPPGRPPRPQGDEGAMSVRLDPRRRDQLKRLASEAQMRPGELVTRWIIERLDGERADAPTSTQQPVSQLTQIEERLGALERRLDEMNDASESQAAPPTAGGAGESTEPEAAAPQRVALHDEIAAVIAERGPLPASEIAARVAERDRYRAPRSDRPIDAATINSRVSNPHYRHRFVRREGRIGLAGG